MKPFQSFHDLEIPPSMKASLKEMSFLAPTPVQADAIPAGLAGKDIIGTAQTGTGKTAAFAVPMLSSLYARPGKLGLVLAPTRELASQIHKVMRQLAHGSHLAGSLVVGGESFSRQANEVARGVDYIIATPGRLNDHLNRGTIKLMQVAVLVLDEVDRMLDMGFLPQIKDVMSHVPQTRQTMLFSATLPADLQRFVDTLVTHPVRVSVGDATKPSARVKEVVRRLNPGEKLRALLDELKGREGKVLVFVRTKSRTHRVLRALARDNISAVCLHGGRSQAQRKHALERFRNGSHPVMIATDLAGRGLDIVDVDHVINFDVPSTREDYIHRIGRTGRAERTGEAISFVETGNADEEKVVTGKKIVTGKQEKQHGGGKNHVGRGPTKGLRGPSGNRNAQNVGVGREDRDSRSGPGKRRPGRSVHMARRAEVRAQAGRPWR